MSLIRYSPRQPRRGQNSGRVSNLLLTLPPQFPLSMMLVAGSQADRAERNKLTVLKISDVQKTQVSPGNWIESFNDAQFNRF